MQITPIILCLVLISIVQAALVTRIPKPKLRLVHSQNLQTPETPKHKLPEERRKFSLFPKSYMKYVISSKPIYEIATHKPIVHGTKKPLMKKLNLLDKKNKAVENKIEQPITNTEYLYENNLIVIPKVNIVETSKEIVEAKSEESSEKQNNNSEEKDKLQNNSNKNEKSPADTANKETRPVVVIEEQTIEIVEESSENQNDNSEEEDKLQNDSKEIKKSTANTTKKVSILKELILPPEAKPIVIREEQSKEIVKESNEKQINDSEGGNKLQNDSNETKKSTADIIIKESPNLKDLVLPPEAKSVVKVSTGNKNLKTFAAYASDEKKNSDENETPDWMEFIFIDPAHKPTGSDKNSNEELEEYITTELYVEPEIARIKRGSNVIEEENLASTVAGYKYTWKDTRLNNDVVFKNIHS